MNVSSEMNDAICKFIAKTYSHRGSIVGLRTVSCFALCTLFTLKKV